MILISVCKVLFIWFIKNMGVFLNFEIKLLKKIIEMNNKNIIVMFFFLIIIYFFILINVFRDIF